MRNSFWNKRIPTYAGLLLLISTAVITAVVVKSNTFVNTRASPTNQPQNVHITNISDTSLTVSYATVDPITGSLPFGETPTLGNIALDDQDKAANKSLPHHVHYITLTNLKPNTKYYFSILSGADTFTNNGTTYTITTGPTLEQNVNEQQITGTVVLPDGSYPKEAVAYLTTNNSQQISTPLARNGLFTFYLKNLRGQDLQQYIQLPDNDVLQINVEGDGLKSTIQILVKNAAQLPTITLSKLYDFRNDISLTPGVSDTSITPSVTAGFPKFSINAFTKNPQIIIPKKDQGFTDFQPEFVGTALPSRNITLVIESDKQIRKTIRTDTNGNWSYRPTTPLSPGSYTMTITTQDETGIVQTISQPFKIFAAGTQQFTEPSGHPTPTLTPTKLPTPTVRPTSTPIPTGTTIPTATIAPTISLAPTAGPSITTTQPTPTSTLTPSPTLTQTIAPTTSIVNSPIPTSPTITSPGSDNLVIYLGMFTFATIIGAMLFFITQGK